MALKIFLLDVLPGALSEKEIEGYISDGTELIVNMPAERHLPSLAESVHIVNINTQKFTEILAVAKDYGGIDALKLRKNVPICAELMHSLVSDDYSTHLKVIAQAGVGLNHIDIVTAESLGIEVFNTPGSNASAVAEFTLLQMLAMLRQSGWHETQMRNGIWTKTTKAPARSMSDITVGLAGSGEITRALISYLKPFQTPITVFGSSRFTEEHAKKMGVSRAKNIKELLSNDVISLHLPLVPDTQYMLNAAVLPFLKKGACLINTSRGGLIDESALATFMRENPGWISGVAVDTFEFEGEKFWSPLQDREEALLTPHIAGSTESALLNAAIRAQQGILSRLTSSHTPE